jgi:DNA-binding transcriptional LysR family regulator
MAQLESFFDVRLADLLTFLSVRRQGTVTGAARELSVTPSQVSKAVVRLEKALRVRLLARGSRGVSLTPAAIKATPLFEAALDALRRAKSGQDAPLELTVAGPSYLLSALLPPFARALPQVRCRGLQMSQGQLAASMPVDQFDVALLTASVPLPGNWRADRVGTVTTALYASKNRARSLGAVTVDKLKATPFVTPVSFSAGQWTPIEDGCPLPPRERRAGHEAQTIHLALDLAAETDQLVFGPRVAAQPFVQRKRLVEVPVPGWDVQFPLLLAVDIDRVTARTHEALRDVAARSVI